MNGNTSGTKVQSWIAGAVVVGFFVAFIFLFTSKLDDDSLRDARLIMLGALTAGFGTVLNYFFGSTRGGEIKSQLLAHSVPTPVDPAVVTTVSNEQVVTRFRDQPWGKAETYSDAVNLGFTGTFEEWETQRNKERQLT